MKQFLLILIFVLSGIGGFSQNFNESNVPIVIINTNNNPNTGRPTEIPDELKFPATRKLFSDPMAQNEINSNHFTIDVGTLMPGIFNIRLYARNGESTVYKFYKLP